MGFWSDKSGTAAVMYALALPTLLMGAGSMLVFADAMREKDRAQSALDASTLAAAAPALGSPQQRRGDALASYAGNSGRREAGEPIETPAFEVAFVPADGEQVLEVRGHVVLRVKNDYSSFIGPDYIEIDVISRARKIKSAPVCVLATGAASPRAIEIEGNAVFEAQDCAVMVNSRSGSAMNHAGKAIARATEFGVVGGSEGDLWSPSPQTGIDSVADPYGGIPVPAAGACQTDIAGPIRNAEVTIAPGTYCGGLQIGANAQVTMSPGVYVMRDGALDIGSGAQVTGENVLIVFVGADATLSMNGGATLRVTSPKSGRYANIQFMSDRTVGRSKGGEEWATVMGGARLEYDGLLYLPEQQVRVSGAGPTTAVRGRASGMSAVADAFSLQGDAEVSFAHAPTGGDAAERPPRFYYGAVLVE